MKGRERSDSRHLRDRSRVSRGAHAVRSARPIAGSAFAMGPGRQGLEPGGRRGARRSAQVVFCTRIGDDAFGDIARADLGRRRHHGARVGGWTGVATGAAHIFVDERHGRATRSSSRRARRARSAQPMSMRSEADIAARRACSSRNSSSRLAAARRGLELARKHGVIDSVQSGAPAHAARRRHLSAVRLHHAERDAKRPR